MADFIRIENNPVPPGGEVFDFRAADGCRLRAAVFQADKPSGGVVLMGGRCEFIEKYFEVIRELLNRGLCVATMDWRGQGLSERLLKDPIKGHIADFAAFRSDLRQFSEEIARKRFDGPLFLLTHSMGGMPALQLLADGYALFDAAVLSAPMTQLFDKPSMSAFAGVAARTVAALGAGNLSIPGQKEHSLAFEGNILTSDPARHARFLALQERMPEAVIRAPTFGWLKAALDAVDDIHKPHRFDALKTPVLIVSAANDQLIVPTDHQLLAARSPLIECVTIKGSLHEILMERDAYRDEFWKAFDAFIGPRLERAA